MKNDKTKLIIWATVALVIGVIIGAFLIGPMTTTGNAKAAIKEKSSLISDNSQELPVRITYRDCCDNTAHRMNKICCKSIDIEPTIADTVIGECSIDSEVVNKIDKDLLDSLPMYADGDVDTHCCADNSNFNYECCWGKLFLDRIKISGR